ncbi:MAG: DNA methyltransferase [Candidatus Margulisbacteria bacterium]|nr:DNA methyltransferase [Candidatus Margulisiibacteriota bacterium]
MGNNNKIMQLNDTDWEFKDADTNYSTHNIHRYSSKYIPQIPEQLILKLTKENDTVLEPFVGSGTTLLEANKLKRNAIGVDINPVAYLITSVKTTLVKVEVIDEHINKFKDNVFPKINVLRRSGEDQAGLFPPNDGRAKYRMPNIRNIDKWYQNSVIRELVIIRDYINAEIKDVNMRKYFVCAFSAIVRPVSNAHTGYGNLMIDKNKRSINNTYEIYYNQLRKMRDGMLALVGQYSHNHSVKIYQEDCRKMDSIKAESVDLIMTHPPYISAVPYAEYLKLSLLWLKDSFGYLFHKRCLSCLDYRVLDSSIVGGQRNKKDVIERFEESMTEIFSEMYRVLRPSKYCAVVIGNPVVLGETVKCDEMFVGIAKTIGFKLETRIRRGKYKTTMGKMKEEFILIFRK